MTEPEKQCDDGAQPTRAGCLLALVSAGVLLVAAVPIVQWRDPETGQPLPRLVAIVAAASVGAVCYGIGTALLWVLGLPAWTKPGEDNSEMAKSEDGGSE